MRVGKVVEKVKLHEPVNVLEALDVCELPLKSIGQGAYRDTYEILGANMVIKFPRNQKDALAHSRSEYEGVKTVLTDKNYKSVRKHMPKIYYFNERTGVLLMRKYRKLPYSASSKRSALSNKIIRCTGSKYLCLDVDNCGNVGVDSRGTLKVLDAGFFHELT